MNEHISERLAEFFSKEQRIETDRLVLRNIDDKDQQAMFEIFSEEKVVYWTDFDLMTTSDDAQWVVKYFKECRENSEQYRWAVCLKESDQMIGTVGLFSFDPDSAKCEIGYDLNINYHRRGYMSEAVEQILKIAFERLTLHRVEAVITPGNPASRAILEKFGFIEEGTSRECEFYRGQYWDGTYFGLLDREWKALQTKEV